MELKRKFDFWKLLDEKLAKRGLSVKKLAAVIYVAALVLYLIIGLQPVGATQYEISGELNIPSIGLMSDVTTLELKDHRLDTPGTIVGSYNRYSSKTFLIGHSTTVFKNLNRAEVGDILYYNSESYKITKLETLLKTDVNMELVLSPAKEPTIIIMTCAGEPVGAQDATHRLLVTAIKN